MKESKQFEHGIGDWEQLFDFIDKNNFSCADFLACVCAKLNKISNPDNLFSTEIMVGGHEWDIKLKRK